MRLQHQPLNQSADKRQHLFKNVNKDGICLLGPRPIALKGRIRIIKHRDETEVSNILQKFL